MFYELCESSSELFPTFCNIFVYSVEIQRSVSGLSLMEKIIDVINQLVFLARAGLKKL